MARPLSLTALVLALWATACGAQSDRPAPAAGAAPAATTVDSTAMARGPAAATVTILEFSDYQ